VKLWVVCIICAVTVPNLNYSYNILFFFSFFLLVIYAVAGFLDSFVYVDTCLNLFCDIFLLSV